MGSLAGRCGNNFSQHLEFVLRTDGHGVVRRVLRSKLDSIPSHRKLFYRGFISQQSHDNISILCQRLLPGDNDISVMNTGSRHAVALDLEREAFASGGKIPAHPNFTNPVFLSKNRVTCCHGPK